MSLPACPFAHVYSYILFLALILFFVARILIGRLRHLPVTQLPGPVSDSWLLGNLPDIYRSEPAASAEVEWTQKFGNAVRIKGVFGMDMLLLSDPKSLHYILNATGYKFLKPQQGRATNRLITGDGLIVVEGETHRRHKRIMTPAFHVNTLRNLIPVFQSTAQKTVAKLNEILSENGGASTIEMTSWLSRTALDAIGEAAFGYKFDAINSRNNRLYQEYHNLIADSFYKRSDFTIIFEATWGLLPYFLVKALQATLPMKQLKRLRKYMRLARSVAQTIVDTQSRAYVEGREGGKDVMSILVKANMSEDPRIKLTEEDLMAQMTTIMFAGHETTASTLSWVIYELSRFPHYQKKIREEIATMPDFCDITLCDLDNMKYLTAVLKETLRFHPIFSILHREATCDEIIPLSIPIQTTTGEIISEIPVHKGQRILISIAAYNRLKSVWGADADVWRPERYIEECVTEQKFGLGVIGNVPTFGSGLHACIGWRFAFLEKQILLIELLKNFEFFPSPDGEEIVAAPATIVTPMLNSAPGRTQLPLLVVPVVDWEA